MFRKLISNLSFSPALVGQLSFYAKRLRKEEATRRVGLIFTALALIVQSFAVFTPPEPANAASSNDFIAGGVSNLNEFLSHYDRNSNSIKDLYTNLGITREEIAATKKTSLNSRDGIYSWGRNSRFSAAQGEGSYTVQNSAGSQQTFYYRPLQLWDSTSYTKANGSTYVAYVGHSAKIGWFAIIENCANLALKTVPPPQVCPPGQLGAWPNCTPMLQPATLCQNLTLSQIADRYTFTTTAVAQSGSAISNYRYTVKRDGTVVETKDIASTQTTNSHTYTTSTPGTYTVSVVVKTSLGDRTAPDCEKTFTIPQPEMCPQSPALRKDSPECQPCPGDSSLWVKDEKCSAAIVQTKTAKNRTQGDVEATTKTARSSDRIAYTITVTNNGLDSTSVNFKEDVSDVVEYASVLDAGGGNYDTEKQAITWPEVTLKPKESQSRMFVVQLASTVPSAAQGISDKASYDCIMTNTFGNTVNIPVDCPAPKEVEQVVTQLPHTGPTENMLFAGVLFAVVAYFYARSRQLKKEVRLIRRDVNTGTI